MIATTLLQTTSQHVIPTPPERDIKHDLSHCINNPEAHKHLKTTLEA